MFRSRLSLQLFSIAALLSLLVATGFAPLSKVAAGLNHPSSTNFRRSNVVESQTLVVATLVSPAHYQRSSSQAWIEALLKEFAGDHTGLKLQFQTFPSEDSAALAIKEGRADLLALRWPGFSPQWSLVTRGPRYASMNAHLYCRVPAGHIARRSWIPQSALLTAAWDTSEVRDVLAKQQPQVRWGSLPQISVAEAFSAVARGLADCTVADEDEGALLVRLHPQMRMLEGTSLSVSLHLGWTKELEKSRLATQLRLWLRQAERSGTSQRLRSLQIEPLKALELRDAHQLAVSRQRQLPALLPLFRKAEKEFGIPWPWLAAIAYQESKWNPEAVSFTGVRGIMMLTHATAAAMGVTDRTDPWQSIWGGAKYFRYLLRLQPTELPLQDRYALALAAYNVGPGHLASARVIAQEYGLHPNSWHDIQKILPKLSIADYANRFPFGLARGQEPVDFAHRVMAFHTLLSADSPKASAKNQHLTLRD